MDKHGKHRSLVRVVAAAAACAFLLVQPAAAACRLALALALDVSGSVDDREYRLQTTGIAQALDDPDVRAALLALPEVPIALAIYEWSSSSYQRLILDWTPITGPADIETVRERLLNWPRIPAPEATGLGMALAYGARLIDTAPPCWDRTLDVSGDGKNNDWPLPERLRADGRLGTMRVNALVVAPQAGGIDGAKELSAYFRAQIIYGPDAFVEVALGYDDYARAMRRKLLRELATRPLGSMPVDGVPHRLAASR